MVAVKSERAAIRATGVMKTQGMKREVGEASQTIAYLGDEPRPLGLDSIAPGAFSSAG